mgnify:CR=1 FL=1|jgi:hypothetical protein
MTLAMQFIAQFDNSIMSRQRQLNFFNIYQSLLTRLKNYF